MIKSILIIISIIILIFIITFLLYLKYLKDNSPSIIGNKYDSELQLKIKNLQTIYSFKIDNCNELLVQQYNKASLKKPTKEFLIKNKEKILEITNILKKLPENGEEYISFADTIGFIKLTFFCDENKFYEVEFYGSKIKTPGTNFYSKNQEEEKNLYNIINDLILEN